jgi:hypothetical protein
MSEFPVANPVKAVNYIVIDVSSYLKTTGAIVGMPGSV